MTLINCDCSIDPCDYTSPSICVEQWRTAHKPHMCCECGETIKRGARYEEVSGLWDGEWDRHHTCATCVVIRQHYCAHGFAYGQLAQQIYDCLDFDYRVVPDDDDDA